MPCDLYLWGFIKEHVYEPPLPADLHELRNKIEAVISTVTPDTLIKVGEELVYQFNVCRVTNVAHIGHLQVNLS